MDTFLIKAVQLILAFAILVIIHEFGHFLFARIFGVKVEKFYIFFDPWTRLFKWKPKKYVGWFGKHKDISKDGSGQPDSEKDKKKKSFWGDTEYGIGWLPLGGYCKISGMIDESMDTEQMKQPPQPWEFRTKPAWQRLLIMVAGVLFNFLLAILIYAGIVYATGEQYIRFEDAKLGMVYSDAAKQIGFRDGDLPISADGELLDNPGDRMKMVEAASVKVLRNGRDTVEIKIPENFIFALDKEAKSGKSPITFMTYRFPAKVGELAQGENAQKAGVKVGDDIIAIDGKPIASWENFFAAVESHKNYSEYYPLAEEYRNRPVELTLARTEGSKTDTLNLEVPLSEAGILGIQLLQDPSAFYKVTEKNYSLLSSIPRGISMGTERLSSYVSSMKHIFSKEGAQSVGGFGSIGAIFPEKWDWIAFWNIAAFLSVALAFMNILPIPALDGGHVLFLIYEVVTRRKPSEKFMEYAQMIGMSLLIILLLYANGMDIVRLFK